MDAENLKAAGDLSAVTGLTTGSATYMDWFNTNAEGIGGMAAIIMAIATFVFYASSGYFKWRERQDNIEAVRKEIRDEFLSKIHELSITEERKREAVCIVCDLMTNGEDR